MGRHLVRRWLRALTPRQRERSSLRAPVAASVNRPVDADCGDAAHGHRALGRPTCTSTHQQSPVDAATHGDPDTRWQSRHFDPPWIIVDLGAPYRVERVVLNWEAAYGREYRLLVSTDRQHWHAIHHEANGNGGIDDTQGLNGVARYVMMEGLQRASQYGYWLWEFEAYGLPLLDFGNDLFPAGGTHTWQIRAINGAGQTRDASAVLAR